MLAVAERAGSPLEVPTETEGHCCGLPFSSKGLDRAYRLAVNRTVSSLWRWTDSGRLPVVLDSSPCARSLRDCAPALSPRNRERHRNLRILDGIAFAHDRLLPRLSPRPLAGTVVLHPVCSIQGGELAWKFERIAAACAEALKVPNEAGCCGFAGDRGFSVPELTQAATRAEAAEVVSGSWSGHYSSSRTCEIALSRATGRNYVSFWCLLERATR
jgi:D-lactate dehydrogenase